MANIHKFEEENNCIIQRTLTKTYGHGWLLAKILSEEDVIRHGGCNYVKKSSLYKIEEYVNRKSIKNREKSEPNEKFAKLLKENNIQFEREVTVHYDNGKKWFFFDFKVGNILVEIDPTVTHNSTVSFRGNVHSKDNHLRKSQAAWESNLECIHVFDWDNLDDILYTLKTGDFSRYIQNGKIDFSKYSGKRYKIKKVIKPQSHSIQISSENVVQVYDCGYGVIFD